MVSLRRRRLLGLSNGHCQRPLLTWDDGTVSENCTHNAEPGNVHALPSDDVSQLEEATMKGEHGTGSSSSKEPNEEEPFPGLPIKRRKKHRRKNSQNQEPCLMRGVYFKNMKWQAAIKVEKKQIHLGTVGSQEEAARLYDRAAFMCGREPNFELSEEEKQELRKFKWEEFLAVTRHAINNKKHRRRIGAGLLKKPEFSPVKKGEQDVDMDTSVS